MNDLLLQLEQVDASYGDVPVLWGISLTLGRQEVVALVGANGAGKSTTLKVLSGVLRPRAGRFLVNGQEVTGKRAPQLVSLGVAHVPEGRKLFSGMTVQENLLMGAYLRRDGQTAIRRDLDWIYDLFPSLRERRGALAGTLSGGEQQMCAIGRGLMAGPRALLIDELSLGLAPVVVDTLVEVVQRVCQERGVSVLLVEQDLNVALSIAGRGYVLESGRLVRDGRAEELLADPSIQAAYLGALDT